MSDREPARRRPLDDDAVSGGEPSAVRGGLRGLAQVGLATAVVIAAAAVIATVVALLY